MHALCTILGARFFFSDAFSLPVVAGIIGYREISEIPPLYRTSWFKQILKFKNGFRPKFAKIGRNLREILKFRFNSSDSRKTYKSSPGNILYC
jgi:hypothetical protein